MKKKKRKPESEDRKNVRINEKELNFVEKRRQEAAPARIGRKKKKRGVEASSKLP